MASEAFGGYVLLAVYGLMLLGAIKRFGLTKVLAAILGIVLLAGMVAFGRLKGASRGWR